MASSAKVLRRAEEQAEKHEVSLRAVVQKSVDEKLEGLWSGYEKVKSVELKEEVVDTKKLDAELEGKWKGISKK